MMDGDEATFGLMAAQVLQGERPIFLNDQPYMGAFQAYLGAIAFSIFGMSREVFKSIALVEFATFALSLYLLARRTSGPTTAALATLFAALPPIYVLSTTARVWGAQLDAMTLGNLVLLLAIDEAYGKLRHRRWPRFLAIGLLGGFGFWLHGLMVIYLATAAVLLFLGDQRVIVQPHLLASLAGFVVGSAPVFYHALGHDYTTFHYLLGVGREASHGDYLAVAVHYLRFNIPRVVGASMPWMSTP
jgi:4-amino-4-deoxy-L-arabinose transferase-like glycosyltransferase